MGQVCEKKIIQVGEERNPRTTRDVTDATKRTMIVVCVTCLSERVRIVGEGEGLKRLKFSDEVNTPRHQDPQVRGS